MARPVARTDDIDIDQGRSTLSDEEARDGRRGGIVEADLSAEDAEHLGRLAFMEEAIEIEIGGVGGENPVTQIFCQVNGENPEILINDRWYHLKDPYFQVGDVVWTKRKYAAPLLSAKTTKVRTEIPDRQAERPQNLTHKTTIGICHMQILTDPNPKGRDWLLELRHRNF